MTLSLSGRSLLRGPLTGLATVLPSVNGDRPHWLFGGASGRSYSDNASVVHAKACATLVDVGPIWVIDRDSPDRRVVEEAGPIASRNTLHAHRLARSAEAIFFSHGVHDVPGLMWSPRPLKVRLGHGLTAFGRTRGRTPRSVKRMTDAIDLAPVASRMEQDHKAEWGFPRSKLPITGLARWDAMLNARTDGSAQRNRPLILYAPTSRPWHSDADVSPTGAFGPVYDFLQSDGLRSLLDAGAFDLAVYFHQITRYRFGSLDWLPEGAYPATSEASLPNLIAGASLVISDYSSILWDALYLDTPVCFFQFDREAHERERGSYIDLSTRLFGPNVGTVSELITEIEAAASDGFQMLPWVEDRQRWQERAFEFRGPGNAERVLDVVQERLASRR